MKSNNQTSGSTDNSTNSSLSRRHFLTMSAAASAAVTFAQTADAAAKTAVPAFPVEAAAVLNGEPPRAPFRVWGNAEFFTRSTEIYSHMTLDASGYVDTRVLAATGKHGLNVIDGTQSTNARGAYYWKNAASRVHRTRAAFRGLEPITSAGLAIMNWGDPLPEKKPDNEKWMLEGLREGKKADPKMFVAAWISTPNDAMFEAGREGLVDLFIVQGFTHQIPDGPQGEVISWDTAMQRCDAFKGAGLLSRTIFGFGYIDRDAVLNGEKLSKEWLGARMKDVKQRFPAMPGVAFLQTSTTRGDGTIEIIKYCDALSAELWPAKKA